MLSYLEDTQKNALTHIRNVRVVSPGKYMRIDAASRRNLELTTPLRADGSKKHTLLYLLIRPLPPWAAASCGPGSNQPLQNIAIINSRLDAVEALYSHPVEREAPGQSSFLGI